MAKTAVQSTASKKVSGGQVASSKGKAPIKKDGPTKTHFEQPPTKKGIPGLWLIPLVSLVMFLWIFIVRLDIIPPFYFKSDNQTPMAIVAILQLLFMVVLALAYSSRTKSDEEMIDELTKTYVTPEQKIGRTSSGGEVDGEELLEVEPEVVEEVEEEVAAPPIKSTPQSLEDKAHGIIEYPPQITGGVYSDTLIPVGSGKILKLRTIIARACLLCDKQVECWPKARRVVSKDDFKYNIECKGGLRRLGVKDI